MVTLSAESGGPLFRGPVFVVPFFVATILMNSGILVLLCVCVSVRLHFLRSRFYDPFFPVREARRVFRTGGSSGEIW